MAVWGCPAWLVEGLSEFSGGGRLDCQCSWPGALAGGKHLTRMVPPGGGGGGKGSGSAAITLLIVQ
jgi:hypothetical protein